MMVFWRFQSCTSFTASCRPMASARRTQSDPTRTRVTAPTQLPSPRLNTSPKPQWPSLREWASSLRVALGGGLQQMMWLTQSK
jgi:hypothetical protein